MYNEHCVSRFRTRARSRKGESKNEKVNVFNARKSESEVTTAILDPFSLSPVSVYLCLSDNDDKYTSGEKRESLPAPFESLTVPFLSLLLSPLNFVTFHEQQPSAAEVTLSFTPSLYSFSEKTARRRREKARKSEGKTSVITKSGTRETTRKKTYKLGLCVQSI
jgi:hypothetical protein